MASLSCPIRAWATAAGTPPSCKRVVAVWRKEWKDRDDFATGAPTSLVTARSALSLGLIVGSPALSNKRLKCKARTLRLQEIRYKGRA
jgi:hypothetical protein